MEAKVELGSFRTNVVLAWVGTNMSVSELVMEVQEVLKLFFFRILILVFTSTAFLDFVRTRFETQNSKFNPYLTFLFWAMYAAPLHASFHTC